MTHEMDRIKLRNAEEEEKLKSGEYVFLTHSGTLFEADFELNETSDNAYKENLANGDPKTWLFGEF